MRKKCLKISVVWIALVLSLSLSLLGEANAEPIITYYFEASIPFSITSPSEFAPFGNTTLTGTFSYDKGSVTGISGTWGVEGTITQQTLTIEFSNGNSVTATRNWYVKDFTSDLWLLGTRGEAYVSNGQLTGYFQEDYNAFEGPNSNIKFGRLVFFIPKTNPWQLLSGDNDLSLDEQFGGQINLFSDTSPGGIGISLRNVKINASGGNQPPIADAGPDQTKEEGSEVTLDGSGSSDPNSGDTLSWSWTQTAGTTVSLDTPYSATCSFTAPVVDAPEDLEFELVVTDNNGSPSDPDYVTIHVLNTNAPPSCELAVASPDELWPPDHKMKLVHIEGVTDNEVNPLQNTVTLTVISVTQDEPVNGTGDGDSSPDAVVQGSEVMVRAERSGEGNGRVYTVTFTADDGLESCTGSVQVIVPHSRNSTVTDDGQLYDSLQP